MKNSIIIMSMLAILGMASCKKCEPPQPAKITIPTPDDVMKPDSTGTKTPIKP